MSWTERIDARLDEVRSQRRWRSPRSFDACGPTGRLAPDDRPMVSFASNDYLGLSGHPDVRAAAIAAVERWGTGSGASRLVVGSRPVHHELEAALATWKGTEAAVVFPTGYAANTGVLATLAGPGTLVCSDARNHASIIDGCRLAAARGATVSVYRHLDLDHLDELLAGAPWGSAIVVSDLVFSMDGDRVPVDDLLTRCAEHGALVVLDEAHEVLDTATTPAAGPAPLVRVGTASKALGSLGGFVASTQAVADLLVNAARPYIFTTALSPADAAAALASVHIVCSGEGDALRARLRAHIDRVAPGHPTPIVPIVLGDEQRALDASAALEREGFLVPAIRPPTVAPGTSRLRVALSAAHDADDVAAFVTALDIWRNP